MANRTPNHRHDCPCNACVRRRNARRRRDADRYNEEGRPLPQGSQLYEIERDLPPACDSRSIDIRRIEKSVRSGSNRQVLPIQSTTVSPVQPRGHGGWIGWIFVTLLVTVVLGGAVYAAMYFDLLQPDQPVVSLPVMPTTTLTPTPTEMPPTETPPNLETQTPAISTPAVTHTPTPTPIDTPIPTPARVNVAAIPTEREVVVNAFAECDDQYSGADRQFRAQAVNLAIEEGRQTVPDIRRLIDEYCNGAIPALADASYSNQNTNAGTERPTLIKPIAIPVPTPTARPTPTKAPTLRPTPTPIVAMGDRFNQVEIAAAIYHMVNAYREEQGRSKLELDLRLAVVAQKHSEDMAKHNYYSHTNRAGDNPTARARKASYHCHNPRSIGVAENIHVLYGHTSMLYGQPYRWETQERIIQRFVADWIGSPGHRQIMLDRRYTKTGVGVGFGPYNGIPSAIFITQKFC